MARIKSFGYREVRPGCNDVLDTFRPKTWAQSHFRFGIGQQRLLTPLILREFFRFPRYTGDPQAVIKKLFR